MLRDACGQDLPCDKQCREHIVLQGVLLGEGVASQRGSPMFKGEELRHKAMPGPHEVSSALTSMDGILGARGAPEGGGGSRGI